MFSHLILPGLGSLMGLVREPLGLLVTLLLGSLASLAVLTSPLVCRESLSLVTLVTPPLVCGGSLSSGLLAGDNSSGLGENWPQLLQLVTPAHQSCSLLVTPHH